MLNTTILMGRFTADPEIRNTPAGVPVLNFTVAVDRDYKVDGQTPTDFIRCVAWRGTAEFIAKNFKKGQLIAIEGSLQTGSYEKDGVKVTTIDVSVETAHFCGGKPATAPTDTVAAEPTT